MYVNVQLLSPVRLAATSWTIAPDSSVHGIFQARIMEWVAIFFSNTYVCAVLCLAAHSCLTLCNFMDCSLPDSFVHGISRQEYWSGLPFPSPWDLPDPGIITRSPTLQANALPYHLSHEGVSSESCLEGNLYHV